MNERYCATCGVEWSASYGFMHTVDCPQFKLQSGAESLDHVDYTPPSEEYTHDEMYQNGYDDGWNDAISRVMDLVTDLHASSL